jgi:hypothetical protein
MGTPKLGVYMKPNGKLLVVSKNEHKWVVDEGRRMNHPFLRLKINMISEMTGLYFINKHIYKCEYLGELGNENVENRNNPDSNSKPNLLRGSGDATTSGEETGDNGII